MEMSTGSGICAGSPIVATSFAFHSPSASGLMSHSLEVSAVAVIAQFWPGASAQRISSGAPGTLRICSRLHRLQVPHHHGVAEVLHGLGILDQIAELAHVVLRAGEARGQQDVLGRIHRDVVAVAVAL